MISSNPARASSFGSEGSLRAGWGAQQLRPVSRQASERKGPSVRPLAASAQSQQQAPLPALRSFLLKEILNIYHVLGEKRSGTGGNCVTAYEICLKSFHFPLVGK